MNQATRGFCCILVLLCIAFSAKADGFFTLESSNGKYGIVFIEGMVIKKKNGWSTLFTIPSLINRATKCQFEKLVMTKVMCAVEKYRKEADSASLYLDDAGYPPSSTELIALKKLFMAYREFCNGKT